MDDFKVSLFYTIKISLISSLVSFLLSSLVLFLIYTLFISNNNFEKNKFVLRITELPLLVPYLIASYMMIIFLSSRGVLSSILFHLGIIKSFESFPILTNDKNSIGIIITFVWKTSAFIITSCFPFVLQISNKWKDLKKIYNLSDYKFFTSVILKVISPTLLTSFIIIFTFILTAFETPYLLGVTYPKTLSVFAYDIFILMGFEKHGVLMAINFTIFFMTLLLGGLTYLLARKFILKHKVGWE
ncbi:MAG: hypothetical protein ACRCSK_00610, partial [Fusobacteriaceae bacterium]